MKVIGAGFGRTGTLSLKAALEQLGFGPCYHMRELFEHREHVQVWLDRSEGKPVDWKALFASYQATVDWPACTYYKELMEVFPDAKILLSVRDPGKWYESVQNTIYPVRRVFLGWMRHVFPGMKRMGRMVENTVWAGTFAGRFEDRSYAIEVFNRHTEDVKRHVPADRLLVYDVKEGWEPLCRFLGVPVPSTPFPRLNDTASFNQRTRRFKALQIAIPIVLALGLVAAAVLVLR